MISPLFVALVEPTLPFVVGRAKVWCAQWTRAGGLRTKLLTSLDNTSKASLVFLPFWSHPVVTWVPIPPVGEQNYTRGVLDCSVFHFVRNRHQRVTRAGTHQFFFAGRVEWAIPCPFSGFIYSKNSTQLFWFWSFVLDEWMSGSFNLEKYIQMTAHLCFLFNEPIGFVTHCFVPRPTTSAPSRKMRKISKSKRWTSFRCSHTQRKFVPKLSCPLFHPSPWQLLSIKQFFFFPQVPWYLTLITPPLFSTVK